MSNSNSLSARLTAALVLIVIGVVMAGAFLGLLGNIQCKATPAAIVELADIGSAGQGV